MELGVTLSLLRKMDCQPWLSLLSVLRFGEGLNLHFEEKSLGILKLCMDARCLDTMIFWLVVRSDDLCYTQPAV